MMRSFFALFQEGLSDMTDNPNNGHAWLVSVLIPAKDEAGNIGHLVDEIHHALAGHLTHEVVLVDDGSSDDTGAVFLQHCQQWGMPARLIRHAHSAGQSTALWTAARHAAGRFLVTIDGDCQNDPADIPALVAQGLTLSETHRHFCIAGFRADRRDTHWKKIQSRIANAVRRRILDDGVPDTGCGLKLVPRATWLCLLYFDHMHRFIPALVKRLGGVIAIVPVRHRHRTAGVSKYTAWNRLWVGIVDMWGVSWLIRRSKLPLIDRMEVRH
jgi:dolichol-phosphate mannosyltransferase